MDPNSADPTSSGDTAAATADDQPDPPATRSGWRRAVGPVLLAVVVAFAAIALRRNWTAVQSELAQLTAIDLMFSALAVTAASFGAWVVWHLVLRRLGGVMRVHPSQVLFFSAQVGKYAPGSVWPALIATQIGRANGVRRSTVLGSYLMVVLVTVASAGLLGPLLLLTRADGAILALSIASVSGAIVLLVAGSHPGGLDRVARWLSERTGRDLPATTLPARALIPIVGWQLFTWVLFGTHVWLLARPLGAGIDDLLPTIAAFALAFVAGLLVFPLPAGAGVREAVLMIALEPAIGRPGALSVALLSRFVIIAVELTIAAVVGVPHAIGTVRARRNGPAKEPV